jgi:chromosome partitioning protein
MEVVAIANQKGGCGKTTTAVNLSACLATKGKKVLLIDLDPQGSATTHLAINNFENTMYEAMMGDLSLSQLATPTEINGLDIIPADKRLGKAEMEIAGKSIAREKILKPKIQNQNAYDFIIIDTPPNLGFLTINAMVASNTVLVPIQTEFFAIQGLSMILDLAKAISEGLGQDLKLRYLRIMIVGAVLLLLACLCVPVAAVTNHVNSTISKIQFDTENDITIRNASFYDQGRPVLAVVFKDNINNTFGQIAFRRFSDVPTTSYLNSQCFQEIEKKYGVDSSRNILFNGDNVTAVTTYDRTWGRNITQANIGFGHDVVTLIVKAEDFERVLGSFKYSAIS